MGLVRKLWEFLIGNFMWLYIIMGLLRWVGIYPMTFQLLMLVSVIYCFILIQRIRKNNSLDLFVFLYLLYICVNSIFIDYPNHFRLWYKDAMFSLLPISCYYIARTTGYDLEKMLFKMAFPITVAMLLGVVFYFYNPAWYSAAKYAQLLEHYGYEGGNIPENVLREMFRLSSIWSTPYVIGYANAIFITFLIVQLLFKPLNKKERRIYIVLFLLSFVVMILAGFKAVLLYFMLYIMYSLYLSNQSKQKIKFVILGLLILIGVDIVFTSNAEYAEFFIERFDNTASEEGLLSRLEYTGGRIDFGTFWGNGFGRYSTAAKLMGGFALQDCQYQKTLAELGIFGFSIFALMLLIALVQSFWNRRLVLEFGIILFYTISFIGSSSISAESTFPFVFWYVMGRISRKTKLNRLIQ